MGKLSIMGKNLITLPYGIEEGDEPWGIRGGRGFGAGNDLIADT